MRLLLSTGVLVLLVNLRPYVHERTFWVDVACYVCLIAQFGLQVFDADREFLGVPVARSSDKETFFTKVITSSAVFRRDDLLIIYFVTSYLCLALQICARRRVCYRVAGDQASFWKRAGNLQTQR